MGNLPCSKCVENLENRLESNLEPTTLTSQAILSAYNKLQDKEPDSLTQTCDIHPQPIHTEPLLLIQHAWRKHKSRKLLKQLQKTHLPSLYFPKQDVNFTISSKFFTNSRKKRKIQYPNGTVFEGDCKGGFRDGYGKIVWTDGCVYEGNWSFGYPAGYGKFIFHDSAFFEGNWVNPFYINQSGSSSSGSKIGFKDGFGKKYLVWLKFKQESCDKGLKNMEFVVKSLELSQKVVVQTEENVRRIEERVAGKAEIGKEGGKYWGDVVAGMRQGCGKQVWVNGNVFIGQWMSDNPHGYGVSTWPDGSRFIGFYKEYIKEGVGFYLWGNKNSYIGEWSRDAMSGIGKYEYEDGRVYIGEWKEGNIEGFGKFVWKDGRAYEGEWKAGKKHGIGVTFLPDGGKTVNSWVFGRIVE